MTRRGIGWLGAGVLAVALGACHDGQYVHSVHATATFDESALDFGEVPVGEWREKVITVHNVGYVPFSLLEVLTLEENASYVVEAESELIPSGQSRDVTVRFHPLKEGELSTAIKIQTDAKWRPEAPIRVRGLGTPARIEVRPNLLEYQTLEVDSDRVLEVEIRNPVDIPLAVRLQGADAAEFEHDVVTIPPLSTQTVKARFAPKTIGERSAALEVLACPDCTPARADLRGRSVPFAFEFDPAPVPFQETPVHEATLSFTQMRNVTWRPVKVKDAITSDQAFSTLTELRERTLAPGEALKVDMKFAARFSGPNVGTMDVDYLSDRDRRVQVVLDARGGRPQLALTPVTIDFGTVPVGGKVEQAVRMTNAGSNGPLYLEGVGGGGAAEHFGVSAPHRGDQQYAWDAASAWPNLTTHLAIQPGADFLDVTAYFQPTAAGPFEATLLVRTDDMFNPERQVVLKGTAYDPGSCAWRVLPWPQLDFGNVPPDTGAILGFRFENAGTNICAVKDIHISDDGGGVFWMPGGSLTGGVVLRDDAFSAMIAFRSKTAGEFRGELSITVNDPANPVIKLPLVALAQPSCLTATPRPLNFGPIRYDCAPEPRTVYVSNACATPVTVSGARIGPGTSTQYAISSELPPMPLTLAAGEGFEVEVTYARTVLGQHYSPLFMDVVGEARPYVVPLWAETNHEGTATDRFVQGQAGQLDVLFVVSNTTTMQPYQDRLKAGIPGWIADAQARGLNLQVGVTTTGLVERSPMCGGGANGGEAGRLFPADGSRQRILQGTSTRVGAIQQNLSVGLCHNLVQGLETMRMALSSPLVDSMDDPRTALPNDGNLGFVRGSAQLAVVFLADEDDHSGFDPSSYIRFLQGLKGPNMSHRTQAHAIVPDGNCVTAGPNGARFAEVARGTGGTTTSICESSYQSLLSRLSAQASGPQARFLLSWRVRSAAEVTVYVDGQQAPASAWSYDSGDNAVVFASGQVPSPGQTIEVRYVSECGTVTR